MRKKLDISNNATTATESSKSKEFDEQSKNQENLKSIRKLSICQSSDQGNGAQIFSQVNKRISWILWNKTKSFKNCNKLRKEIKIQIQL